MAEIDKIPFMRKSTSIMDVIRKVIPGAGWTDPAPGDLISSRRDVKAIDPETASTSYTCKSGATRTGNRFPQIDRA